MSIKINDQEINNAKSFAFDGCHKIYICESVADERDAASCGYSIHNIADLEVAYLSSCGWEFISNWKLTQQYVEQLPDTQPVFDFSGLYDNNKNTETSDSE